MDDKEQPVDYRERQFHAKSKMDIEPVADYVGAIVSSKGQMESAVGENATNHAEVFDDLDCSVTAGAGSGSL